jgi:hypothetical protein
MFNFDQHWLIRTSTLLIAFVSLTAAARDPALRPPKVFIDQGACPFEGCVYRQWTVTSDTVLYNRPAGTKVVAMVRKGETVNAINGEVRVVPTPMIVVLKHENFRVGDKVYLLTYLGEGWMEVWFKGQISCEEVPFIQSWMPDKDDVWPTCTEPSSDCWGRIEKREPAEWWILIKTHYGQRGWTKQYDHFIGADRYG